MHLHIFNILIFFNLFINFGFCLGLLGFKWSSGAVLYPWQLVLHCIWEYYVVNLLGVRVQWTLTCPAHVHWYAARCWFCLLWFTSWHAIECSPQTWDCFAEATALSPQFHMGFYPSFKQVFENSASYMLQPAERPHFIQHLSPNRSLFLSFFEGDWFKVMYVCG